MKKPLPPAPPPLRIVRECPPALGWLPIMIILIFMVMTIGGMK